jgi:protein SCO1/2
MDRSKRELIGLGLGLAPAMLAGNAFAAQTPDRPMSRAARAGMFPNVPLVTQNGEKVRFYEDLIRDKTVLINFFLVECTDGLCPTAISNLRKVQDLLGERMGKDIYFLSITLQPKKDTPSILKEYSDNFDIKPGWLFLTGKPAEVETLRRALGYVDSDPERDRDLSNHVGMARYGNDRLERWGGVSLRSSPQNIASTFKWLTQV